MGTMRGLLEHEKKVTECLAKVQTHLDIRNASPEELTVIARITELQVGGHEEELLEAFIQIGDLQTCPLLYWQDLSRAGHLMWRTLKMVNVSRPIRVRRAGILEELRRRVSGSDKL